MEWFLAIAAIVCGIVGVLGAILPVLPGTILSYAGLVCAFCTSTSEISVKQLVVWGVISAIAIILDYILPGYFSKTFGGTKEGVRGATIGVFVGMFFGPLGIILGPFVGAVAGEMSNNRRFGEAIVVGLGSLLSFIVGTGLKLIIGGFMLYYIWVDVFQVIKDLW